MPLIYLGYLGIGWLRYGNTIFAYLGDLAPRLIDELAALVDEVFVPLLSNPLNHEGWPLVVSQDILKQIHNLKSTVYEVRISKYALDTNHMPLW